MVTTQNYAEVIRLYPMIRLQTGKLIDDKNCPTQRPVKDRDGMQPTPPLRSRLTRRNAAEARSPSAAPAHCAGYDGAGQAATNQPMRPTRLRKGLCGQV